MPRSVPSLSRDTAFRQCLAELELTSCAPTQSFNQGGSHGAFASRSPTTGDNQPPHLYFRERWDRCESDGARERVLEEARKELASLRKRTSPVPAKLETRDALLARIVKEAAGWSVTDAATALRCAPGDVKEARKLKGLKVTDGTVIGKVEPEDRPERARRLREANVSTREIARQIGVDQKQVIRWTRDEAA